MKNKNNDKEPIQLKKAKNKLFTKKNILLVFIPLIIAMNIFFIYYNPKILELKEKIRVLETKIDNMEKEVVKKKITIALVTDHIFLNGIARFITVLADLLVKTGKYEVYLINEQKSDLDFKYNKKIKREIMKKDFQLMKDFDESHDIQIYIINNDLSNSVDIYHSFGKKVISIFHGVYLSCAFQNYTGVYQSWQFYSKADSFVHIIPDDYWVYKKFGFNNTIYIPNIISFDSSNLPSAHLTYKNLLMVGRADDVIKGAKYGILAMYEIVKIVPDAKLTMIGIDPPQYIKDLIKQLHLEQSISYPGFSHDISQFYVNTSVLLLTSVSEAYPMVVGEAKAT